MKIINNSELPKRADVLLADSNPEYSRAALAKLFHMGNITKDGKILKPGDKLQPGKNFFADIEPINARAESIDIPIIFENDNIIVVDKPAGVISHARGRYWDEPSVASFIREKISSLSGERAGIVHRLDRVTSGVMICAKNQETLSFLQKQFADRKVKKQYTAVVKGEPKQPEAVIDVPLARNPKNPKTFCADSEGRHAITNYKVVKTNNRYSMLILIPFTGRTHQIRVHLQYIKHPIVGDHIYDGEKADRLFLHAHSLEITIPGGERKIFESPVPSTFMEIVK